MLPPELSPLYEGFRNRGRSCANALAAAALAAVNDWLEPIDDAQRFVLDDGAEDVPEWAQALYGSLGEDVQSAPQVVMWACRGLQVFLPELALIEVCDRTTPTLLPLLLAEETESAWSGLDLDGQAVTCPRQGHRLVLPPRES